MMKTFILPEEIRENACLPIYHQIYTQLKKELFFGNYGVGSRFFSIRDLRARYAVNAATVHATINRLVEDGFVTSRPMSGIYVNSPEERSSGVSMGNLWFCQLTGGRSYPFYSGILAALQKKAELFGMRVIVKNGANVHELERWFGPETGDGLVVSGNIDAPVLRWLRNTPRLRYVIVGNYDLPPGMPNVRMRIEAAVYRAMELCAQSRRRKIAVIINPAAKVAMREIMEGIAKAEAKGLVKKVGEVLDPNEDGYAAMLKLRNSGCDSVFVSEDAFFGLCRYVFEHRSKCQGEFFIIRYGKNEEKDIYGNVAAITVTSDKTIMAERIMSTLFAGGPVLSEMDYEVARI